MRHADPRAALPSRDLRLSLRLLFPTALALLAACDQPTPSATQSVVLEMPERREAVSEPSPSPPSLHAVWAATQDGRLLYGVPGSTPLLTLECDDGTIALGRVERADPQAKAFAALIGNGHVERFAIDSVWNGRGWLWLARLSPLDPSFDALTGDGPTALTVPGAGRLEIRPSPLIAVLRSRCRADAPPAR